VNGDLPGEKRRAAPQSPLVRLKPIHKKVCKLHLQGLTRTELAEACNLTPARISQLLADPLVQAELEIEFEYQEQQLRALGSSSVQAIRRGLDDADPEIALKAARLQLETQGRLRGRVNEGTTAEDVVSRIVNMALQINVGPQYAAPDVRLAAPDVRIAVLPQDAGLAAQPRQGE
jgi:hypothetical protein